jgi:inhibitor of cysteine peptidase
MGRAYRIAVSQKGVDRMNLRSACGWVLIVVLLGAFALAGCGSRGGDVVVTDADAGEAVTLDSGQNLVVRLESNPSTGYSWEAIEVPGVLEGEATPTHEQTSETEGVVGAAGTDVFTFTASEDAGEGTLVLEYRRPWEEDVPADEEFVLEVTVR